MKHTTTAGDESGDPLFATRSGRGADADGLDVRQVAASRWEVRRDGRRYDGSLGHVEYHDARFYVGLEGESPEPYTFATLDGGVGWFAEYVFALELGSGARR